MDKMFKIDKMFNALFLKFLLKYSDESDGLIVPETIFKYYGTAEFSLDFLNLVAHFMIDNYGDGNPYEYLGNRAFDKADMEQHFQEEREKIFKRK